MPPPQMAACLKNTADSPLGEELQSINRAEDPAAAVIKAGPQQHAENNRHYERPEFHAKRLSDTAQFILY